MSGQSIPFDRTGVQGELTFDTFGCNVFKADNMPTPDRVPNDVFFERGVRFGLRLPTPDGKTIEVWRFEDALNPREVMVYDIAQMNGGSRLVYDPSHPHADPSGNVHYPTISQADEMTLMVKASRAYEANLVALAAAQQMYSNALQIGRSA